MTAREAGTEHDFVEAMARRRAIAVWVAREVIPHESRIRAWCARTRLPPEDVDELVQEAYCRIAALGSVDHIDTPYAYFFSVVRNLVLRRLRRQKIVPFEAIAEIESVRDSNAVSAEQTLTSRMALDRARAIIATLPERCRRVVEMRKIEGLSQRAIAETLGMTEKAVEKQVWLGVRAIRKAWAEEERDAEARLVHHARRRGVQP